MVIQIPTWESEFCFTPQHLSDTTAVVLDPRLQRTMTHSQQGHPHLSALKTSIG